MNSPVYKTKKTVIFHPEFHINMISKNLTKYKSKTWDISFLLNAQVIQG